MTNPHDKALKPCPFCGGEAAIEQTGKNELTLRCVGVQPSGLLGCGPKYVQKAGIRFTLEWLADRMTEKWNSRAPIEAGNGGYGSIVRGWFVKDYADGWIYFDNEEDAKLQVDATGAMMLIGVAPYNLIAKSPAEQFARWLEDGPRLAKAAGCYVGIKVTNLPSPPSPSNEGEKQP